MTYLIQSEIAINPSMATRVAQCAAQEGKGEDADAWAHENRRVWAAAPGWEDAWASALASHPPTPPVEGEPAELPYDPGADEAVITDGMILAQVQAMT